MTALSRCIITDQPLKDFNEIDGGFEYVTSFNDLQLKLKFVNNIIGEDALNAQYKILLKALYFRKEWPFDLDALLSMPLIDRYNRFYQNKAFPAMDDFNAKVLSYLVWIYNNGGDQNKQLQYKSSDYLIAFANDEEEFSRIYEELKFKNYISIISDSEFKITAIGKNVVEKILSDRPQKIDYKFPYNKNPCILVFNDEKDKTFAKKLCELFPSNIRLGDIKKQETFSSSYVRSARRALKQADEFSADYFLFIKSNASDTNNTYGSVLTVAEETHREVGLSHYPLFISIPAIDDSYFEAWPTYDEYHSRFYDVRINQEKERLVNDIFSDWAIRQNNTIKNKDDFFAWMLEQKKILKTNALLIRPTNIKPLVESEALIQTFLESLEGEKFIRLRKSVGCGRDKYEYEVTFINTDESASEVGLQEIRIEQGDVKGDAINNIERLLKQFHEISVKLRARRENRQTLKVNDEYDVQDLLHALLSLYFLDVRKEDYNIQNVGSNSRIDFVLRNEEIVIEVKMANKNYREAQMGKDLLIDIGQYKAHPYCKTLIIFIYDKHYYLTNKYGFISDLEKQSTEKLKIKAFIGPM